MTPLLSLYCACRYSHVSETLYFTSTVGTTTESTGFIVDRRRFRRLLIWTAIYLHNADRPGVWQRLLWLPVLVVVSGVVERQLMIQADDCYLDLEHHIRSSTLR